MASFSTRLPSSVLGLERVSEELRCGVDAGEDDRGIGKAGKLSASGVEGMPVIYMCFLSFSNDFGMQVPGIQ